MQISGIRFSSTLLGGLSPSAIYIANCAGAVMLADVVSNTGLGIFGTQGSGLIFDSTNVTLDRCSFESFPSAMGIGLDVGQPGLYVSNSFVHVNNSTISGAAGSTIFTDFPLHGGPGIRAEGSTIRISRSVITGGMGGFDTPFSLPGGSTRNGGPATEGPGSQFFVRGGAGNLLQGGAGGSGTDAAGMPTFGNGAPAMSVDSTSFASTSQDSVLVAGTDPAGGTSSPAVLNLGTYLPLVESYATLGIAPNLATLGSVVAIDLGAEPNSSYFTFYSFSLGQATSFPGVFGVSVLNLSALRSIAVQTLDAQGVGQLTITIPMTPSLVGVNLVAQGLSVSPGGQGSISAPSLLSIH